MARLIWTSQAVEDLESTCDHIARDSHHYARMFAQRVMERVATLQTFSDAGRTVPEVSRQEIREIIHGNYRIIYRHSGGSVQILTIHHSSRRLDTSQIELP